MRDFLWDVVSVVVIASLLVLALALWGCERARVTDGQAVGAGACALYAWSASQSGQGLVVNLTHDPDGPGGAPPVDVGGLLYVQPTVGGPYRYKAPLGLLTLKDPAPPSASATLSGDTLTLTLGPEDTLSAPGLNPCVQATLQGAGMTAAFLK